MLPTLCLQKGSCVASLDEVMSVPTPEGTNSWQPVPHGTVIEMTKTALSKTGFEVVGEKYGLRHENTQLFGVMELRNGHNREDYSLLAGLRNSHDKTMAVRIGCGSRVFVCDNMSFSAEVVLRVIHSTNVLGNLRNAIDGAIGKIGGLRDLQDKRIETYKQFELGDSETHDIVIQSLDEGVIPNQRIPQVLQEWRKPSHPEFLPRTAWSAFNAFTEVLKAYPIDQVADRTISLHRLFDRLLAVN